MHMMIEIKKYINCIVNGILSILPSGLLIICVTYIWALQPLYLTDEINNPVVTLKTIGH